MSIQRNIRPVPDESVASQLLIAIASLAAMRSALQVPAPSSRLLKFLKSQSESICFFSPNPRAGFIFDHAAPRGPQLGLSVAKSSSRPPARNLSTTRPRRATVEAGFLNLDFLLPRSANTTLNKESALSRGTVRSRRQEHQTPLL